jgi:hypothetical protein
MKGVNGLAHAWGRLPFLGVVTLALALAGCSDSPTEVTGDGPPAQVVSEFSELVLNSIGDTVTVGIRVLDAGGRALQGVPVTWRYEGDPVLVPVNGIPGRYRSVAVGTGQIIAEVSRGANGGTIEARIPVSVLQVPVGLAIEASQNTLWSVGAQQTLQVRSVDARGNPIAILRHQLSWSSADAAIAQVDQDGRVTAMRDGVTVISAQFAGLTGARTVRVSSTFGMSVCHTFDLAEEDACNTVTFQVRERPGPQGDAP